MKAFEFRLQRILEYRRQQADIEQARLDAFVRQIRLLDEESASLERQKSESREGIRSGTFITGYELASVARFDAYVGGRRSALEKRKADIQASAEAQRRMVAEAHRNVKLLERLRERRMKDWTSACDRELEELAAESHLARLMSEHRLARPQACGSSDEWRNRSALQPCA